MPETLEVLEKALRRERARRKEAERLLEEKSRELYESYTILEQAHADLKDNQNQLLQSEKMASLGVLSAGVAHEINNPVGFVLSNINSLSEYLPLIKSIAQDMHQYLGQGEGSQSVSPARDKLIARWEEEEIEYLLSDCDDILDETNDGLGRVRDIVSGLREYARADDSSLEFCDVNDCVRSIVSLVGSQLKYECSLETDLGDVPQVAASSGRLGQVFMNLIVNAGQALTGVDDGRITITSKLEDNHVCVQVTDNGCGISAADQAKLFTPFFTTKPPGEGTGLGLSISYRIIEDHGGRLEVESEQGVGTCFSVVLPTKKRDAAA